MKENLERINSFIVWSLVMPCEKPPLARDRLTSVLFRVTIAPFRHFVLNTPKFQDCVAILENASVEKFITECLVEIIKRYNI